jgi:hypothetical protein
MPGGAGVRAEERVMARRRRIWSVVAVFVLVALGPLAGVSAQQSQETTLGVRVVPVVFDPQNSGIIRAQWGKRSGVNGGRGVVLAKNGPTATFASAIADFRGERGLVLNRLGFDLHQGTYCGAGAPRFNLYLENDPNTVIFLGCSTMVTINTFTDDEGRVWERKRVVLGPLQNAEIHRLLVVHDEEGRAVLDNFAVSNATIGRP